jgi:hypothetical protein
LLLYPQLRLSLGQAVSGFDLDQVLADGKILLVPLARRQLGDELCQLVGSLVATKLWSAVQGRAEPWPLFWYIDEFQGIVKTCLRRRVSCSPKPAATVSASLWLTNTLSS